MENTKILFKKAKVKAKKITSDYKSIEEANKKGDYSEVIKILLECSELNLIEADNQLALIYVFKLKHKDYNKAFHHFSKSNENLIHNLNLNNDSQKAQIYFELSYCNSLFDLSYLEEIFGKLDKKFTEYSDLALKFCNDQNLEVKIFHLRGSFFYNKFQLTGEKSFSKLSADSFKNIIKINEQNLKDDESILFYNDAPKYLNRINNDLEYLKDQEHKNKLELETKEYVDSIKNSIKESEKRYEEHTKQQKIKNQKNNDPVKKSNPVESYDGYDLKYIHTILIEYFKSNKGFFGGYKPAKYSDLAIYLSSVHTENLRSGNKEAQKIGLIPPMSIPEAVLSMEPFLVERKNSWDPGGANIIITIKN